ncbi:MAG: hypothetical protein LKJ44_08525 [Bifidobacteriaceae bacterium]|jgi:hypothetical protein|nr:hypothetical protein [Bifidobacteriaceae bacterium]MCI1979729.1 hypothetical protein [Bifidobacteriaceae bacterium]
MEHVDIAETASIFSHSGALEPVAREVKELVSLWPLQDAMRIDNDVKYGEELQVRVTREMAARMSGEDVTVADAEYVYEGAAEQIPGRPDSITTALLASNDAYDDVSGFSDDRDVERILSVAETVGYTWSAEEVAQLKQIVTFVMERVGASQDKGENDETEAEIVDRLALSAASYAAVLSLGEQFASVGLLFVNELNEIQGLPRLFVELSQSDLFVQLAGKIASGDSQAATDFIADYADVAKRECVKHRDDVLWDPDEAKKRAKEEDEAKNKAALAAKFKDVKSNDEGKEPVEL